jgi:hypothetical protein
MGRIRYDTVVLQSSSGVDTTTYSSAVFNGYLESITISTGGLGWTRATTATTGISSTGVIKISSERTGAIFLSVAPPGAGGATYLPRTGGHTSSGGQVSAQSTSLFCNFRFPLSEERLVVQSSSGSDATAGYCHTIKILVEGA